jgi:hypothetical protein
MREPVDECQEVARSIGLKADRNKNKARFITIAMTISTASIPVVIGLSGADEFWGKAVPSCLAALSAVLVAVNQLERPHERWVLYRRYQRLLEAEQKKHRFLVAPYDKKNPDKELGMKVAQLEIDLQTEWEGLVPSRSEIAAAGSPGARS